MAQRRKKSSDNSNPSPSSDQVLKVEEKYWTSNASPSVRECHEHEECPSHCNKKSVLAKVKEGAKKIKGSLSGRRKHLEVHNNVVHDKRDKHEHEHEHKHEREQKHEREHRQKREHKHKHEKKHERKHEQKHEDKHDHEYKHEEKHEEEHEQDHEEKHEQEHKQEHEQGYEDHVNPSWTSTLEDEYLNEKDYDPEFLGAPMYESQAAPDCLKETARQHPRAEPVVSERHRAPAMTKDEIALLENDNKAGSPNTNSIAITTNRESISPNTNSITTMTDRELISPNTNTSETPSQVDDNKPASPNAGMITNATHTVSDKLAPAGAAVANATHTVSKKLAAAPATVANATHTVSDKLAPAGAAVANATHTINTDTITNATHTVSDKLAPAGAAVANATHTVSEKLVAAPATVATATHTVSEKLAAGPAAVASATHTVSEKLAPACAVVSDATHQITNKLAGTTAPAPESRQVSEFGTPREYEEIAPSPSVASVKIINEDEGALKQSATGTPQQWDKGVSVKEYFLNKLEPGEDERALSHVITEAISPRHSAGEPRAAHKVKGAVTSIFWQEENANSARNLEGSTSETPKTIEVDRLEPSSPSTGPQLNRVPSLHVRSSEILDVEENTISSPLLSMEANEDGVTVYDEEKHGKIRQIN